MLFAGQPVEQFPCSKLIQDEINLLSELRNLYKQRITWCHGWAEVRLPGRQQYQRCVEAANLAKSDRYWLQKHVDNSCAATHIALQCALQHGIGINLGGGFHHATLDPSDANNGCLVNDILLAIQNTPEIQDKKITIIDLDAHSGGGTRQEVDRLPLVYRPIVFDLFTTKGILSDSFGLINHPIQPNCYADHFSDLQVRLLIEPPEIVFLIAGGDVTDERFMDIPLTVHQAIDNVDRIINDCQHFKIPLVITLGGGYNQTAKVVWKRIIDYGLFVGKTTV